MSDDRVFRKCAWRVIAFALIGYAINYLDRSNVGYAALTMNRDLGFSASVYGLGAGMLYVSYALFAVPANLMLHRIGARRWMSCIFLIWGALAAANALVRTPSGFYMLRFALGMAEAGFFPGMILYLSFWFPKAYIGRMTTLFMSAAPASLLIGGALASGILQLDGHAGLHGWQWLFLIEGAPACLAGIALFLWLPDGPAQARWLDDDERRAIKSRLSEEGASMPVDVMSGLLDPRVWLLGLVGSGILIATIGFGFWLPLIVQGLGFGNFATGMLVASIYLSAFPVMLLCARQSDRRGERVRYVASAALFGAAMLITASAVRSELVVLVALAGAAAGMYSALPLFTAIVPGFLRGGALASGFAMINMIDNLVGGFAGQYGIGVLRERTGNYVAGLLLIALSLVLAAAIVLAFGAMAPRTAVKPVPAE
jgi:ACS family tartrate transporter-like MFS transporter